MIPSKTERNFSAMNQLTSGLEVVGSYVNLLISYQHSLGYEKLLNDPELCGLPLPGISHTVLPKVTQTNWVEINLSEILLLLLQRHV